MEREIDTRTSWHVVTQNCRVEDVSCKGACKSVILGVILGSACKSKPIPFPTTGVCTTLRQRVWKKYQNVSDQYPYWHLLTFAIFCIECTSTSTLQVCPLICSCIEAIFIRRVMHATDPGAVSRGQVSSSWPSFPDISDVWWRWHALFVKIL